MWTIFIDIKLIDDCIYTLISTYHDRMWFRCLFCTCVLSCPKLLLKLQAAQVHI